MSLISNEYRALNAKEHADNNGYGVQGYRHLNVVLGLADQYGAKDVLDYGCGGATLAAHARKISPLPFHNYDPAIEQHAALPRATGYDMVVCTDVLEHIEPLCLNDVMKHLAQLTLKVAFIEVACRPAKRVLSDGRNAHLIQRDGMFWLDTMRDWFDVVSFKGKPGHSATFVVVPGGSAWI